LLRAHETENGEERWQRDISEPIYAIYPTADRIYVRAHRSIYGLSVDGTVTWSTELDNHPRDLVLGTKTLYVGASRQLQALQPETGERRWARTLPATNAYGIRRLISVDGGVFVLQHSGDLYTFDDTGQPAWRPDGSFGAMSTDGERLYCGAEGVLRCFMVTTGKQVWNFQCRDLKNCDSARYIGKPVLTDEAVYVPIDGGILAGVDPSDGSVRWSVTTDRDVPQITIGDEGIYSIGDYEQSIERRVAPSNSDR
jgi:outer membrane protein assembly factor BamB